MVGVKLIIAGRHGVGKRHSPIGFAWQSINFSEGISARLLKYLEKGKKIYIYKDQINPRLERECKKNPLDNNIRKEKI